MGEKLCNPEQFIGHHLDHRILQRVLVILAVRVHRTKLLERDLHIPLRRDL